MITSANDIVAVTWPTGGWKKQGRTVPSVSTTADTQGALQGGATGSIWPRPARKWWTMRRSFFRRFGDERPALVVLNQPFDLFLEDRNVLRAQRHFRGTRRLPSQEDD